VLRTKVVRTAVLALVVLAATATAAQADPHPGQSVNVALISDTTSINSGTLPTTTTGPTGSFTDFVFTNVLPASVNAATLAAYDTVLLNVASVGMLCNVNTLTASQKTDLVNFLNGGGKLIIYDSECAPQDYSWLPRPFTTSNPGQLGGTGTVNVVEDNFLGSDTTSDSHFIDELILGQQTDAVGDMNVLTTEDPNICLHMSGTNAAGVSGPTHVYYQSGSGLLIYNGFDIDFSSASTVPDATTGAGNIAKIWLQELQQPRDGTGLACAVAVVGISLTPQQATNPVGTSHTVTATVTDSAGAGRPNVLVTFTVTGSNAGATGTCNPATCQTDANGQVTFTYTGTTAGTDNITACFTSGSGSQVCSAPAEKTWESTTPTPCTVKVTNGGWIVTDDLDRASFGGVAKETSTGTDSGSEEFLDHGPADPMNVHSLVITDVACSTDGTQATIFGIATVDGTGSHAFQIDVQDNGEPGKGTDHYRMQIPDIGYDSGDHILRGGNVQIH
jgi:hypothetical protein